MTANPREPAPDLAAAPLGAKAPTAHRLTGVLCLLLAVLFVLGTPLFVADALELAQQLDRESTDWTAAERTGAERRLWLRWAMAALCLPAAICFVALGRWHARRR